MDNQWIMNEDVSGAGVMVHSIHHLGHCQATLDCLTQAPATLTLLCVGGSLVPEPKYLSF